MFKILMPINPKYVDEILSGRKKYEYRKIKAKKDNIDKIIIYSTFPVMKVVAEVTITKILEGAPREIWNITKEYSGVTEEFYNSYYKGKNKAIAYEIGEINKYDIPKELSEIGINYIPQSFVYID